MLRAREDDETAFRELVEATEDRIYGTIVKMLGGLEGAEDLAQKVYLRVWQARKRYEPTAKFSTWMFSITRRLVLNERRGRGRQRQRIAPRGEGVLVALHHIQRALEQTGGNRTAAAKLLEISHRALLYKLRAYFPEAPDEPEIDDA
jgi:RNA polymerase sigma factor (sigma-70 family)